MKNNKLFFLLTTISSLIFFVLSPTHTYAQLCNGFKATPIFAENFGSGVSTYGGSLPGGVTNYAYVAATPGDGQYTICKYTADTASAASLLWILDTDHTGNPDGYMMVANAAFAPGEFYRREVTGLCPNTAYIFSGWIANVNAPAVLGLCGGGYSYPNVNFQLEYPANTVLSSISTGAIPVAGSSAALAWGNYGITFTTGPGQTSIEIVMINNAPGGCGNDLVIDDIELYACVPIIDISINSGSDTSFCEGDNLLFSANYIQGNYLNPEYQWQYSSNNGSTWTDIIGATQTTLAVNTITGLNAGTYRILASEMGNLSNATCNIASDIVTITVHPVPLLTTSLNQTTCSNSALNITLNATPALNTYTVTGSGNGVTGVTASSNASSITDVITYTGSPGTATYTLQGTSADGCMMALNTLTVSVNPAPSITSASTQTICSGQSVNYPILPNSGGIVYSWLASNNTNVIGESLTTVSSATITDVLSTTSSNPEIVIYDLTGQLSGCPDATQQVTVTVFPLPQMTSSNSYTICSGQSTNITLTSSNPSALGYTWIGENTSNVTGATTISQTSSTINDNPITTTSAIGIVTYTVIPNIGSCNGTLQVITVTVNPTPTVAIASVSNSGNVCSGSTATITPSGASTYTLMPGNISGTTFTVNPTSNTTYTITGSSASGCLGNEAVTTVTVISTPTVGVSSVSNGGAICNGDIATITPSGASTYTLMPGNVSGTSFTVNPSSNTTYTITGTSASGCVSANTAITTVTVNALPTISIAASSDVKCLGTATGAATVSVGGSTTYTVTWDGSATGVTNTSLAVGTHTAVVVDIAGCSSFTTVTISAPSSSLAISVTTSTTGCGLSNGSATITPSGGWNTAYTYTISNSTPSVVSTTNTVSGLAAGSYDAQVMDANGCIGNQIFNISNPTSFTISATASNTLVCSGNPVVITSGGGAVSYTLVPGNLTSTGTSFTVNPTVSTVYNITGTSSGNCVSNVTTVTITVSTTPTVAIASVSNSGNLCSGSTATITPSGAFTYTLMPDNITGTSFTVNPTSNTTYSITGTSASACAGGNTAVTTITVNALPSYTTSLSQSVCSGSALGINLTTVPASNTYTVTGTSNGVTGVTASSNAAAITDVLSYVSAPAIATYSVISTSTAGCVSAIPTVITVTVTQGLNITSAATHTICSGAAVNYNILPNSGGINYTWQAINNTNVTGETSTPTSGSVINDMLWHLSSNPENVIYNITGQLSGCPDATKTVTVTVNAYPAIPSVSAGTSSVICNNGIQTATLTASGGTNYQWYTTSIAGTPVSTSNPYITPPLTSNTTYYVEVVTTGTPACSSQTRQAITVTIQTPSTISETVSDSICGVDSILNLTSYINPTIAGTWSGPGIQNDKFISSLAGGTGTYTITFTTNTACQDKVDAIISVIDNGPLNLVLSPNAMINLGQSYSAVALPDNFSNYVFTVNNSQVQNSSSNTLNQTPSQTGDYTVIVVGTLNGCSAIDTIHVLVKRVPNVFTPNGDGKNDLFGTGFEKQIINRWGDVIFEGKDGWDGKDKKGQLVVSGTYFYVIKETDPDTKKITYLNGSIELLTTKN